METIGIKLGLVFVLIPAMLWLVAWQLCGSRYIFRLIFVLCILFGITVVTSFGRNGSGRHASEKRSEYENQNQHLAWFDGARAVFAETIKYDPFYVSTYVALVILALVPSQSRRDSPVKAEE